METQTESGGASSAAAPAPARPAFFRELEALRAQREPPAPELGYTIGGSTEQSVHREVSETRETRIAQLETRFTEIRSHASNEFGVSQVRGAASRDFGRER